MCDILVVLVGYCQENGEFNKAVARIIYARGNEIVEADETASAICVQVESKPPRVAPLLKKKAESRMIRAKSRPMSWAVIK